MTRNIVYLRRYAATVRLYRSNYFNDANGNRARSDENTIDCPHFIKYLVTLLHYRIIWNMYYYYTDDTIAKVNRDQVHIQYPHANIIYNIYLKSSI